MLRLNHLTVGPQRDFWGKRSVSAGFQSALRAANATRVSSTRRSTSAPRPPPLQERQPVRRDGTRRHHHRRPPWRSFNQLERYPRAQEPSHRPAWVEFNRRMKSSRGNVGIWRKTYLGLQRINGTVNLVHGRQPAGSRRSKAASGERSFKTHHHARPIHSRSAAPTPAGASSPWHARSRRIRPR